MAKFNWECQRPIHQLIKTFHEDSMSYYPLMLNADEAYALLYPEGVRDIVRAAAAHVSTHARNNSVVMPWDGSCSPGAITMYIPQRMGENILPPTDTRHAYDVIMSDTPLGNKIKSVIAAAVEITEQWAAVSTAIGVAALQSTPQQAYSVFPKLRDLAEYCLRTTIPSVEERQNLHAFVAKLKAWRAPTHEVTLNIGEAAALRRANTVVGIAMVAPPEHSNERGNTKVTWSP